MNCSKCDSDVPNHQRNGPACGKNCGFPNVRIANQPNEIAALNERLNNAQISANARHSRAMLNSFETAAASADAVLSRPLEQVNRLIADENQSYASFQQEVIAGTRSPQSNELDQVRMQYEEALFPYFSSEIIFASLTLDGPEFARFGACSIILKEPMIEARTTIFEENPHTFVDRHGVLLNQPIPFGFRATWKRRGELAVAKLNGKISGDTTSDDYSSKE